MNVFRRELRANRWSLLLWSVGIVAMIYSGMAKYAAYQAAGQSVVEVLDQLPRGVRVIFGLTGFDLGTAAGFYGVLFIYLAVMGAVHAVLLGANIIAKEERDRTSEFLFVKPASRSRVLTGKLLAGLVNVALLTLVTLGASLYFVDHYGDGEQVTGDIVTMTAGLFLLQVVFLAVGALVAGVVRRPRTAASVATSVMFGTFLLYYVVNLDERLSFLRYLTPFKYYDAAALMTEGLDPRYVTLSAVIVAAALVGTYRAYGTRDLTV